MVSRKLEEMAANSILDLQRLSLGAPKGNRTDHAAQMPIWAEKHAEPQFP